MENYAYGTTPSTLSHVPTATSPVWAVVTGGLRRHVGPDVCPRVAERQGSRVQGIALPIATQAIATQDVSGGRNVTPMADVRLVKFRSGSQALPLTG